MAVQAQYPSNALLPLWRHRMKQVLCAENRNLLSPGQAPVLEDLQQLQTTTPGAFNQLQLVAALPDCLPEYQQTSNAILLNGGNEGEIARNLLGARKRSREISEQESTIRQRFSNLVQQCHHNQGNLCVTAPLATGGVSTGLRLSFDDNRLNSSVTSTSGRAELSSIYSSLSEELASEIQKHREEVDQHVKMQGEQLKRFLEEKRQKQFRALLSSIEEGVTKKLRTKDAEVEKIARRNLELEERVKQISLEAHIWQNKAKCNEAMVSALRTNLQQAEAQSREQSREGCGDSEADDAASSHLGENADLQTRIFKENKELKEQRTCRVCRSNDVCMLLLPCRHLCLCQDCEVRLEVCPLCRCMKSASVQVYMA